MHKSLTRRIIWMSMVWIVIALVATGYLLNWLYREHIQDHYDAHVFMHVEELIAAVDTDEAGNFQLLREPSDPRFSWKNSGWYWTVLSNGRALARSVSLGDRNLDVGEIIPEEHLGIQVIIGPNGEALRAHTIHVSHNKGLGSLTFVATAPEFQISDDVKHFNLHIVSAFLVLGIVLGAAVVIQVRLALKPLKAIRQEISEIKAGKTERLSQGFPADVQPLVDELNFLLDHNEMLLRRARNQLGDLAHAVKNPLTVIRNEARSLNSSEGQLILEQTHIMGGNIDHYLSRARMYGKKDAFGYRTSVRSVLNDIAYAVGHIYKDRNLDVQLLCIEDKWFRGESQDLEEMAGNLLDNACKWARSSVVVHCQTEDDRLELTVEDDGPGIPEQERDAVMRRGHRLDEAQPGHGQGLGIVRDIAQLYGGELQLGRSESLGGLEATLVLPAA